MASAGVPGVRCDHARALACRRPQRDVRSPRASDSRAVYRGVSLVQTHDAADDGGGVRRADARGDEQPLGAGHDRGGRRASGRSPHVCARARGGTPRRDQLAAGQQTGVVMGGGDKRGDGVYGAAVTRWPGGPRAVGGAVWWHLGDRSLECLPLVPGAVAAALLGALTEGLRSDARPWRGGGGAWRRLAGAGAPDVYLVASGA